MVTLKKTDEDVFDVVDLAFFNRNLGWFPILEEGKWCEPRSRNTQEELDELEAMFPPRKVSRKRQKLLDDIDKIDEK